MSHLETIKPFLFMLIGAVLMFLVQKHNKPEEILISTNIETIITSDTSIIQGDTSSVIVNAPTEIKKDSIQYVARWYPSQPYAVHDTTKDTVLCYIPILVYSDTVKVDSLNTIWYTAKTEGTLKNIKLGFVANNLLITDSIVTNITKKKFLKEVSFYGGLDVGYNFKSKKVNQFSIPLTIITKNRLSFTVRPEYDIISNSIRFNGGIGIKLNK
jgi:hypothetical protein